MTQLNPNKETIRRICSIFKCNNCWLLNNCSEKLSLWVQLDTQVLSAFKKELESWSGNLFDIYNFDSNIATQKRIKQLGEQLLPVDSAVPLKDIEKRRKPRIKKPTI